MNKFAVQEDFVTAITKMLSTYQGSDFLGSLDAYSASELTFMGIKRPEQLAVSKLDFSFYLLY